jgi:hypothetical protein
MTAFSYLCLVEHQNKLQFVHLLPVLRKTFVCSLACLMVSPNYEHLAKGTSRSYTGTR